MAPMSQNISAGLLMCRNSGELEFFLVHPGGPFFKNKNLGAWSIPKGIPDPEEDLLLAAQREFQEETGLQPSPPFHPLGTIKQKRGKVVHAWAFEGSWDKSSGINSNTFELEWPPKSGRLQKFPEADKAAWMNFEKAKAHIIAEQIPLLERAREIHKNL
jgi:predicted NUDIX family NTP pyrophosphohydrolase